MKQSSFFGIYLQVKFNHQGNIEVKFDPKLRATQNFIKDLILITLILFDRLVHFWRSFDPVFYNTITTNLYLNISHK